MKTQFLGKALNKAEQRQIQGGYDPRHCVHDIDCYDSNMKCEPDGFCRY